jgi:glutamine synthetase
MEFVGRESVEQVDLKFSDLFGTWHHLSIPATHLGPELLAEGVGFDAGSVGGFKSVEHGDMVLVPDLETAFVDPFLRAPTLSFICNVAEADTRDPFDRDPRRIATKACDYMVGTGIADDARWGPEFEFFVFDRAQYGHGPNYSFYRIESVEANWEPDADAATSYPIEPQQGYHAIPPKDTLADLRAEMCRLLDAAGVGIRYHHHEVGSAGQSEIEVTLESLLAAADNVMKAKYFVKMVCSRHGKVATFMPKPLPTEAGSGMHFHQHLFSGGRPLFHDPAGYAGLSTLARQYIAGLLHHGPALLAFTNPSINSYRRIVPGYEAPVSLFFSLANRSAAVRIPKYASSPHETRIEFRPPDATCNPYLAMSAMLLAGLDGIQRGLDPGEEGFGPIDENIFELSPEEQARIKPLPGSLPEALACLEDDHDFLTGNGVFPEALLETWIRHKRDAELAPLALRPHPYEFTLYFDA